MTTGQTTAIVPAYAIVTEPARTIFGKRETGKVRAKLTGRYGSTVAEVTDSNATLAKATMLQQLAELVDAPRPSYIFCGDGETVLTVYRTFNGWEYEITSAKRTMASGCMLGASTDSRKQAVANAIAHAEQGYGGVVRVIRGTI